MISRMLGAVAIALAAQLLVVPAAVAQFTDFEDLTLNASYPVGSTFTSSGIGFKVVKFGFTGVPASVGNFRYAGGGGKEMWLGNTVGLEFQLPGQVSQVSMRFGTFCCETGVVVNGVASPLSGDLNGLNGMTYGGVLVNASEVNSRGIMTLTGAINSLVVGGTEFAIDDVRVVPEPASALLATLGIGLAAVSRRRKR